MAVTRAKKAEILAALQKEFESANSAVFATSSELTVADSTQLRRKLNEKQVKLMVAKKTLIKLAAKNAGKGEITDDLLPGAIAVAFSHGDELAGAQELYAFAKDHESVKLTGAVYDGEILNSTAVNQLATIPGKQALLGQLAGLLLAPLRGIAGAGYQTMAGLARALDAAAKKGA